MLSGSAILRVVLVIVAAACIAGIVQHVWLRGAEPTVSPAPDALAPAEPVRTARPAAPARTEPVPPPAPPPQVERTPAPPASAQMPVQAQVPAQAPVPSAQEPLPPPPPAPPEPDPVAEAEANAPPAAVALVDLNTASLAALNGLRGGGAIGRTIIQHRPYSAVEQLLSKRVLNRATYQRIKDQVTAQ